MTRFYPKIYETSLALLTDFYQLTMACGFWKENLQDHQAVFHMFFRNHPFNGGFTVAAGLQQLVDFVENFRFTEEDLSYLREQKGSDGQALFPEGFLEYLRDFRMECDIDAVPEGTVVFPYEPLVRVRGPLIACQLLESPLLSLMNFPTLIATRAARLRLAAGEDTVLEFGMRRAQGIDGGLTASRAAYIGGCDATSNVLAGRLFGIPVKGTHAHSWVMVFDDERASFRAYADAMPANCIFLVDTYDTIEGVKRAIEVGKDLKKKGHQMVGVRLDSGDITYLSSIARAMLDEAGFPDTKIVASNELDEQLVAEMKNQGCQVQVWGVGTNLVTARDDPALGGVYKLSAIAAPGEKWQYKLKLSEQLRKISNPGVLQVARFKQDDEYIADVIYDEGIGLPEGCTVVDPMDATRRKNLRSSLEKIDLLQPIFREGKICYSSPTLKEIQEHCKAELSSFHKGVKRFVNPHAYVAGLESGLYDLKTELIEKIRRGGSAKLSQT